MSRHNHHNCAVSSCGLIVTSDLLMCKEHWSMVPGPMQEAVTRTWRQGGAAAYLAARAAAVKAVQAALKRGAPTGRTVTGINTVAMVVAILALCTQGCMIARYQRLPACPCAGTNAVGGVRFNLYTCFLNEKAAKISVDKFTGKTHSGITIGTVDSTVDDEAFKAMVSGVVEGAVKGVLGL